MGTVLEKIEPTVGSLPANPQDEEPKRLSVSQEMALRFERRKLWRRCVAVAYM